MSILYHFGKVKTTYVPYTSKYKHDGIKIYCPSINNDSFTYHTDNVTTKQIIVTLDQVTCGEVRRNFITPMDGLYFDGFYFKRIRQFILQDFADIIKKITDNFASSIWKKLNISPLLSIHELLWLKVDDIDSHVDHLEKMLIPVIEENKLLQRKIDLLEKSLAKERLEKMIMQVMEENQLLQHRLEALEQKGILYELD